MKTREWETSRDAVPPGHTQVTVYDVERNGQRVATVFDADAVALIAAAPQLLAALEGVTAKLVAINPHYLDGSPSDVQCKEIQAARAAIAKAKGEA